MATIKSYSDLEQSKTLAEFLPLESSDMWYVNGEGKPLSGYWNEASHDYDDIPCWSLAALLDIVSSYCSRLEITLRADKKYNVFAMKNDFVFRSFDECSEGYNNLVDACVDMIVKLHELNLL